MIIRIGGMPRSEYININHKNLTIISSSYNETTIRYIFVKIPL